MDGFVTALHNLIRVPADEIERFRIEYAMMPELRKTMGVAAFQPVHAVLAMAGIVPAAAGPRLTDGVYPRAAAMAACLAAASRQVETPERGKDRKSVAQDLHVSVRMVRELIDAGLLAMQEGCHYGSIAPTEVTRFRGAYVSTPELKEAFGEQWSKTLVGKLRKAGVQPVCSPPAFHFQLYRRQEAEDALRSGAEAEAAVSLAPRVDLEPSRGLAEIAKQLDCAPSLINQIVRTGLMTPLVSVRRGQRTTVAVSEVERFAKTYVFANELGRLAGREQRHGTGQVITRMLIKGGIKPVCSKPDYYGYLFDRVEAEAMMRRLGSPEDAAVE